MLNISKASAGSGKTYQLAKEYITLLLGYYDHEAATHKLYIDHPRARDTHKRILAITFTIKATEEMKKRIVLRLYELSCGKKSDYLADLQKLYNAPEAKIRLAAKKALHELLSKFSFFNVNTIDSFFQTILRAMAFELDQTGDFAIEINDDMVLSVALQDLIWSLRSGYNIQEDKRKLRSKLEKYLLGNIDGKSNWNLFPSKKSGSFSKDYASLSQIVKYINSEGFKLKAAEIKDYFSQPGKLDKFKHDVEQQMDSVLKQIIATAQSLPQALAEAGMLESHLSRKNNQPFSVIYKAQQLTSLRDVKESIASLTPNDTYLNNYKSTKNLFIKSAPIASAEPILKLLEKYLNLFKDYLFLSFTIENLDALSLIYDVYEQMEKYREDNDTVLLSQTTEFLSKIVTADDAPFIYERMGVAPKHFLIDEFQDTSKMQWQILDPLLQNNLSEGNSSLIIGDVKQSIYRFRNADPSLLHSGIEADFKEHIPQKPDNQSPEISTNFRSRENIVKFNNTFFALLAEILAAEKKAPLISSSYSNVVQHVKKTGTGGYVTIDFIDKDDESAAADSDEESSDKKAPYLNKAFQYAVDAIKRGYKPSDIAFLSRTNPDNEDTVNYLLGRLDELTAANGGVPVSVVSDESLLLRNSPIINAIVGLLEFISGEEIIGEEFDPENRNLYLPLIAQFFHREWAKNYDDASAILQKALDTPVQELRDKLVQSLDTQNGSLYAIIERIIANFDDNSRQRDAAYLLAFQDIVIDYSNNYTPTIAAFIKWWKNNNYKLSITTPPNENAINVMTIHKSKGLEFEILIIPLCKWSVLPLDSLIWFDTTPVINTLQSNSIPPVLPIVCSGKALTQKGISREDCILNSPLNAFYQNEMSKALADGLNLTYVAFTRAGSELHIITGEGSKPQPESIYKYTKAVLDKDSAFYEKAIYTPYQALAPGNHFIYLNNSLEWGAPSSPLPKNEEEKEYSVTQSILASYKASAKYSEPEYSIDIIPPGPRGEGTRMHKIMEGIRTAADVEHAVRRCAARGFIDGSEESVAHLTALFTSYISQPEPSTWFAPGLKVLREQWMYYDKKQIRADRVVFLPNGQAVVIDYKFGEEASHIYFKKYLRQIKDYMAVLKASGYTDVVGKIWHPESGEIRTVTL